MTTDEFLVDPLQKVRWLIHDCGQQAKQMAAEEIQVFEKGVNDYVTDVDRLLDERLFSGISALFPQDGVVTEENLGSQPTFIADYRRLWLVDPIDNTRGFIEGKTHYAVMVGLLQDRQPILGWVYAPALELLYYGGQDQGLFEVKGDRPPQPLILKEPAPPSTNFCPILLSGRDRRLYGDAITQRIPGAEFSSVGSFGLKVIEVILGRVGIYIYLNRRVKPWDTAGPIALARAAGLVCCDLEGNPLQFTPEAVEPETLTHCQPIIVGWPRYVDELRSPLRQAIQSSLS